MLRVSDIVNVMKMKAALGMDPLGSSCDEHRGSFDPHPADRPPPRTASPPAPETPAARPRRRRRRPA